MHSYRHLASLLILFTSYILTHGATIDNRSNVSSSSPPHTCSKIRTNCTNDGLIIPLWRPQHGISTGDRISRAIVYLLALIYLFIGVAIISDRFMASIEVITSQKREIRKKNPDGTISVTTVAIWNETVSNLTLMALGSSAPEILLSIIEVVGKNFESGDLGPGTIVGSAAFNSFVIIAICIVAIPAGEVRRIRHLRVFFVTTAWSIFAYIWLWAIVAKISPGYIEVWEGTLTFLFFPLTVFSAYIVDTKVGQFIRIRITSQKQVLQLDNHTSAPLPITLDTAGLNEDSEQKSMMDGAARNSASPSTNDLHGRKTNSLQKSISGGIFDQTGSTTGGFDESIITDHIETQRRQEFIDIWRQLRKQYPNHDTHTLNDMAAVEMMNRAPKSRGKTFESNVNKSMPLSFFIAYYRIQATKRLGGGGNIKKKLLEKLNEPDQIALPEKQQLINDTSSHISKIRFEPNYYAVLENAGHVTLHVLRTDGNLRNTVYVDYMTEDGTATHGGDYEPAEGTLIFYPMETHKQIQVKIIDDEIFEEGKLIILFSKRKYFLCLFR
jgi:solute carrier family 8 (sodium/calcium exchanger)